MHGHLNHLNNVKQVLALNQQKFSSQKYKFIRLCCYCWDKKAW